MNVWHVEGRKKPWAVDWRDRDRRFRRFFKTREEARDFAVKEEARGIGVRQRNADLDPYLTLVEYVPRFFEEARAGGVAESTLARYQGALEGHILPVLGEKRVRDITRADVRSFRLSKQAPVGLLKAGTVHHLVATLSAVLGLAVDDGVLLANPAFRSERQHRTKAARAQAKATMKVKAFTAEQAALFLETARQTQPEVYPAMMLMTHSGLRVGEAMGLRWESLDLKTRTLRIHEQLSDETTKSGTERTVDVSAPLAELLKDILNRRREESLAAGRGGEIGAEHVVFPWLTERPTVQEVQKATMRVRRGMARALEAAGLPDHHTPHSLRHSFCSLLIAAGVSPVYVQQQAGHASVQMTVGTYGSWFPAQVPGAMDQLAALLVTRSRVLVTEFDASSSR